KRQLKLTSVVVTHDLDLMYKVADRVVFLYEGGVFSSARPPIWRSRRIHIFRSSWRWIEWSRTAIAGGMRQVRMAFLGGHTPRTPQVSIASSSANIFRAARERSLRLW